MNGEWAARPTSDGSASTGLPREHARVHIALTDREARAVVRATALVADLLILFGSIWRAKESGAKRKPPGVM